jgi:hypothetical protein
LIEFPQLHAKISAPKSVIPACLKRESRRDSEWTPDKNIPGVTPHRADTRVGPYVGIPNDGMVGAQFIAPVI